MNEQLTAMFGSGNNGAPSSSVFTNSAAMTCETLGGASASSRTTTIKTEKRLEKVKQEKGVLNPHHSSAHSERATKRQRTVIELD